MWKAVRVDAWIDSGPVRWVCASDQGLSKHLRCEGAAVGVIYLFGAAVNVGILTAYSDSWRKLQILGVVIPLVGAVCWFLRGRRKWRQAKANTVRKRLDRAGKFTGTAEVDGFKIHPDPYYHP